MCTKQLHICEIEYQKISFVYQDVILKRVISKNLKLDCIVPVNYFVIDSKIHQNKNYVFWYQKSLFENRYSSNNELQLLIRYGRPSNNAPPILIERHETVFSGSILRRKKWLIRQIKILTYSWDFNLSNMYCRLSYNV